MSCDSGAVEVTVSSSQPNIKGLRMIQEVGGNKPDHGDLSVRLGSLEVLHAAGGAQLNT